VVGIVLKKDKFKEKRGFNLQRLYYKKKKKKKNAEVTLEYSSLYNHRYSRLITTAKRILVPLYEKPWSALAERKVNNIATDIGYYYHGG
jgi:hypothetical protein